MDKQCLGCMELYEDQFDICPHCGYVEGAKAEESIHVNPGTLLEDRYIIGRVLGYGGFGVTYIAWDKLLEQKVAIKEYLPGEFSTRMPGEAAVTIFSGDRNEQFTEGLNKFVEEAKRLSKFQNEQGIVKIFDSFRANDTAYIVMEYLDGETLETYLQREGQVSEDKAVEMLLPILNSLQVVHKEGILHRDIAPENIFITKDGDVKLIDFGASRYATTSHSRSLTVIIKPGYSPEEQYRSRGDQGPHTDIYALAATMYKMMTGVTPPDALERRALIETKKKDLLKDIHKVNKGVSRNVENAILNAMNVQIEDRTPDIESFVGELNSEVPVKRRYGKIKKIDVYGWPLWLKITVPSFLVACITVGVLLLTEVISFPTLFSDTVVVPAGMVVVPELEGMGKDEAIATIEGLGLKASAEGNVESSYIDAGKIVLQSPAASSFIKECGTVYLTVSSGSEVAGPVNGIATVPYVVWDTQENAIAKFKKAGLGEPIIEYKEDANVEVGKVISQSVKENEKTSVGTQVTLVISKDAIADSVVNETGSIRETGASLGDKGKEYTDGRWLFLNKEGQLVLDGINFNKNDNGISELTIPSSNGKNSWSVAGLNSSSSNTAWNISIKILNVSEGITSFTGVNPFAVGNALERVNLPNSLVSIADSAFSGCKTLKYINLPSRITTLEKYMFYGCESLKNIELPETLLEIKEYAFGNCSSLESIKIPQSVRYIDSFSFGQCTNLKTVYFATEEQKQQFAHCFPAGAQLIVQ